jgi:hypothetical protein
MSAAIILAGLFSWYLRWVEIKPSGEIDFGVIPLSDGDWSGQVKELSKEETEILRANRTFSATYRTPTSTEVDVFIAYFHLAKIRFVDSFPAQLPSRKRLDNRLH